MQTLTVNQAVRKACREILSNSPDAKVARALELLGVSRVNAYNHGLAHFDAKSITKAVNAYFTSRPVPLA